MIGPIARWAIKQALLQTAKAVDTKIAANKKAEREAEVRQEEEREAADPAYRAYKDALREKERVAAEKARIAREVEDRKQARLDRSREILWKASKRTYLACILYCLISPSVYHWLLFHESWFYNYEDSLQRTYINHIRDYNGWLLPDFMMSIMATIWILTTICWALNELREPERGCGIVVGLVPRLGLGYIFLHVCEVIGFGGNPPIY